MPFKRELLFPTAKTYCTCHGRHVQSCRHGTVLANLYLYEHQQLFFLKGWACSKLMIHFYCSTSCSAYSTKYIYTKKYKNSQTWFCFHILSNLNRRSILIILMIQTDAVWNEIWEAASGVTPWNGCHTPALNVFWHSPLTKSGQNHHYLYIYIGYLNCPTKWCNSWTIETIL